jgi:hypothetical protein
MTDPRLFLERAVLHVKVTSIPLISGQHTEITLQDVLNHKHTLRLIVENEEKELQRKDNRTWTPTQRPYVPGIPTM